MIASDVDGIILTPDMGTAAILDECAAAGVSWTPQRPTPSTVKQ